MATKDEGEPTIKGASTTMPEGEAETDSGGIAVKRTEKDKKSLLSEMLDEEDFKPNIPKFQVPDLTVKFA